MTDIDDVYDDFDFDTSELKAPKLRCTFVAF